MFFHGQGQYMRERGIQSHAISSPGEYLSDFAAAGEMVAHPIPITRTMSPIRDAISVWRVWRRLIALRPHIVEAHTTKAALVGMLAAWLARVPVRIYHNHGVAMLSATGIKRVILRICDTITCRLAHESIYVAPSVMQAAVAEGLCPPAKASAILSINGLDADERFNPDRLPSGVRERVRARFEIPTGALVLGYVGRIFRVKGIVELVRAWGDLASRYPQLYLLVAGEFDDRVPVPSDTESVLRSHPRIRLAGYANDVPHLLMAMDVLTLPSHHEGLGYALIEASAMRLPVVGTTIPGIIDAVVDGETGTLVAPGDADALAHAIARYLDDEHLRERHGLSGRAHVLKHFRRETVLEAQYRAYVRLLLQRGVISAHVEAQSRAELA
jgi:glycosyltransferase involved in cell wall biosynthesis